MAVDTVVNITPVQRAYIGIIACPEVVNNCVTFITDRVAKPDADAHTNIRIDYSLEYACPGTASIYVINAVLDQLGIYWRIHSAHVLLERELCRIIIRKISLLDLTTPSEVVSVACLESVRVIDLFRKNFDRRFLVGPSNIAVFSLPSGGYYFVYTCVFDMWEYSDDFPEVGWKAIM